MQFRLKISVSAKGGNKPLLERVIDLPDSKSLSDFPFAKSIDVFNALFPCPCEGCVPGTDNICLMW